MLFGKLGAWWYVGTIGDGLSTRMLWAQAGRWSGPISFMEMAAFAALSAYALWELMGLRYVPNNYVGIVEKLWSRTGSVEEGRIVALNGEAGYQADMLRGGFHFGLWRWQYRLHRTRLVTVPQGTLGYVYARDGEPLTSNQTLGRTVDCSHFQDTRAFLAGAEADENRSLGQRGRQRGVLREGVYAINLAQFIVITEDQVYYLRQLHSAQEVNLLAQWQTDLKAIDGFQPVIIGGPIEAKDPLHPDTTTEVDGIGIVTVHDGPSLESGEIIAPAVGFDAGDTDHHNNFQDPEAFLRAGGRRGRQYQPLTDGTYFINRWFATIEPIPKTVVPIGYVGVVVSYIGRPGRDRSGVDFRHGERVAEGERGVWERPLGPGKYAFNTYAGQIVLVPTTNFVLHWITGKSEAHRYDESLRSIDLVTKDAYEPLLPLSVVVHIDYQKAPNVIQRFGDVKRLITQTLDPMLSAYFRDVAHKKTMLDMLHNRDTIHDEAREELRKKFLEFDMECVDVLIGKPQTAVDGDKIENLLEQLRLRQLAIEQVETYARQQAANETLRGLNEAQALAAKQPELTNSQIEIRIAENHGEADLARARKQAEQVLVTAQAESQQRILAGRGEGSRVLQTGLAEASVLMRKISSLGDPRLYALMNAAGSLATSSQPLVPDRVFIAAGGDGAQTVNPTQGILGTLLSLLVAEKSGFQTPDGESSASLQRLADHMSDEALRAIEALKTNGAVNEA